MQWLNQISYWVLAELYILIKNSTLCVYFTLYDVQADSSITEAGVGIINPHVKFMIDACTGAIIVGVAIIKKIKHVTAITILQELYILHYWYEESLA